MDLIVIYILLAVVAGFFAYLLLAPVLRYLPLRQLCSREEAVKKISNGPFPTAHNSVVWRVTWITAKIYKLKYLGYAPFKGYKVKKLHDFGKSLRADIFLPETSKEQANRVLSALDEYFEKLSTLLQNRTENLIIEQDFDTTLEVKRRERWANPI